MKTVLNILKLRKAAAVALQEKDFNPADTTEWEWRDVKDYKVKDSYYYCFLLSTGSRIPEPVIIDLANTFWHYLVPEKFWDSVQNIYSTLGR